MSRKIAAAGQPPTYRAKVTGRHAVTLPAALCRELAIENGDTVEFQMAGNRAVLRRFDDEGTAPEAKGILKGYFDSWEDVQRFVEEERRGWAEREANLEEFLSRPRQPGDTSSS
jgi:bifunctional DNA-binding transcriptional regulator/antitoxin component of YhaV-PrlF toxin-antitoxin module